MQWKIQSRKKRVRGLNLLRGAPPAPAVLRVPSFTARVSRWKQFKSTGSKSSHAAWLFSRWGVFFFCFCFSPGRSFSPPIFAAGQLRNRNQELGQKVKGVSVSGFPFIFLYYLTLLAKPSLGGSIIFLFEWFNNLWAVISSPVWWPRGFSVSIIRRRRA